MLSTSMTIEPIGFVESCYTQRMAAPRQSMLVSAATAILRLEKKIQPEISLRGIEGFSHLWLIFGFHKNTSNKYSAKVHPPRLAGKSMGVFATRSPHRWNPLGLSLVKIENVGETFIEMSGVDLIDGTPVYDIKPYLAETEAVSEASAGWTEDCQCPKMAVDWPDEILQWLPQKDFELISQSLALDPRPATSKDRDKVFQLKIGKYDLSFICLDNERFLVKSVSM